MKMAIKKDEEMLYSFLSYNVGCRYSSSDKTATINCANGVPELNKADTRKTEQEKRIACIDQKFESLARESKAFKDEDTSDTTPREEGHTETKGSRKERTDHDRSHRKSPG